jgi:nucleoside-diphosphate-sugar epimerase
MPISAQRVLVTGATGYTGGNLCRRLIGDGHSVRAVVRDASRAAHLTQMGVEVVPGDLLDKESLGHAVGEIDVVYHIAANFRRENISHQEMWAINAWGTQSLLEAAAEARVGRFVHCSTFGVHGSVKNPPGNEDSPLRPGDEYQRSKLGGEMIARRFMNEGRLPVVIFRPAAIYGPGDRRWLKLVRSVKRGYFVMLGSGETRLTLIYIDDLVEGIIQCGTVEGAVGETFILAGESIVTLSELVEIVARAVGW